MLKKAKKKARKMKKDEENEGEEDEVMVNESDGRQGTAASGLSEQDPDDDGRGWWRTRKTKQRRGRRIV